MVFPNTVPPFFPFTSFFTPPAPTDREDYERRWAGLQAHNRWLVDFCNEAPGRRAGVAQILLNDVDDAVREIEWVAGSGLTGGILLPGIAPDDPLPGIWTDTYESLWAACAAGGVPINHHGGAAAPNYGTDVVGRAIFMLEVKMWTHRTFWHVVFAGVFERYPSLKFVLTEQGAGWLPLEAQFNDMLYDRMRTPGAAENYFGGPATERLLQRPSEYFRRNGYLGASFMHRKEVDLRYEIGVDRIMWGSDFPHNEGTYPFSKEALQAEFAGVPRGEVEQMLSLNAADVYGFDLDLLRPIASEVGPLVGQTAMPLVERPASACSVFDEDRVVQAR